MDQFCGVESLHSLKSLFLNSTFSSTLIASITIILVYICYRLALKAVDLFKYYFTVSVTIVGPMNYPNTCSDLYQFTINWLNEHAKFIPHTHVTSHSDQDEAGKVSTSFKYPPAITTSPHYFIYKSALIQISRSRIPDSSVYEVPHESLTLTTLFYNKKIISEILSEIHLMFKRDEVQDETKTRFFYAWEGQCWNEFGNGKRRRPLSSVILNNEVLGSVVGDVKEFLDSEEWYRNRGIPYRRGYLLYGEPGNGKSSFVKALAGEIGYNICIMSLTAKNLNDDSLNTLMNTTEEKCIILLEDIDAAFPSRSQSDADSSAAQNQNKLIAEEGTSSGKVTLRGLLNALDGVASTEGRLVFLTTNHILKLDPALTRPGRVDMKVYINLPDDDQLGRMFSRFYVEGTEGDKEDFIQEIRKLKSPVSMAMIQGLFMLYKKDCREMISGIDKYFQEQFFALKTSQENKA